MAKEVIISSSAVNINGFRVITSGIQIAQYQRNPILLWNHNRWSGGSINDILPIGRMENLRIDGDHLIGTPVFDNDDFAKKIKAKWESGTLNMVSAGLNPLEWSDKAEFIVQGQTRPTVIASKLIEISIVDIGANDDAVKLYNNDKILNLSNSEDECFLPKLKLENNINNINDVDMKVIALKLGLPETATETDILTRIGTLQTQAGESVTLRKQVDDQRKTAVESEVDAAIALKKITADKRDHFVALGETAGVTALKATLEMIQPAVKPTDIIDRKSATTGTTEKGWKELSDKERIELRENDTEKYSELFKVEYGINPDFGAKKS
jgi:hypothetical protein